MKYCHDSSFQIDNAGSFWKGNFWFKHSNHLKPFSTATENCRIRGFSAALVEANRFNKDGILFVSSEEQRTQQDNLRIAPWLRWRLRFFEAWLRMILYHTLPAHPQFGRLFFWASWKLKPPYFRTNIFLLDWHGWTMLNASPFVQPCCQPMTKVMQKLQAMIDQARLFDVKTLQVHKTMCQYESWKTMSHRNQHNFASSFVLLQSECWVDACLTKSE